MKTKNLIAQLFPVLMALVPIAPLAGEGKHSQKSSPRQLEIERAKKELDSFVGQTTLELAKEKKGWETQSRQTSGMGFGRDWKYGYLVLKKGPFYGLLISDRIPHPKAKPSPNLPPWMIDRYIATFLLTEDPKSYRPSLDCTRLSDWAAMRKRCDASKPEDKGINCSLGKLPEEMLAFVKPKSPCATFSEKVHSAYRYDFSSQQLKSIPGEGYLCGIEDVRPSNCPPIIED